MNGDLYAGISGAQLPMESFDLGEGVSLSRTYAHLMAPYVMAFSPASPGKPHPAPWRAAKGGLGFDVVVELRVPGGLDLANFDRFNRIWWFAALLRFRAAPSVLVPVVASESFSRARDYEGEIQFWPVEVEPYRLQPEVRPSVLLQPDLEWIREHWRAGSELMHSSEHFNLLFQACDQSVFVRQPPLALLMLWGGLEAMFAPVRTELRFRTSATIAAYLEKPGEGRQELQKKIAKLYDARSAAAHGGGGEARRALAETLRVAKRVVERIVHRKAVPRPDELDGYLFGTQS